jgi:hypothetical protein
LLWGFQQLQRRLAQPRLLHCACLAATFPATCDGKQSNYTEGHSHYVTVSKYGVDGLVDYRAMKLFKVEQVVLHQPLSTTKPSVQI